MLYIEDYYVLQAANLTQLEMLVKNALKDGWQPIGGAFVIDEFWYQTMVKYAS